MIFPMERDVYFPAKDGVKLCGTLTLPANETDSCVILCHGISVSRNYEEVFPELALILVKKGFAVFRFDFRGHGDSGGDSTEFTISGQLIDIKAAVDRARAFGYKKLGLAGASVGGGAAALFAAKHPKTFKALALLFPVVDYDSLLGLKTPWSRKYFGPRAIMNLDTRGFTEVGSHHFKIGRNLVLEMKSLKPWRELPKIKIPVLFIHGNSDDAVPVGDSIKYSKTAQNALLAVVCGGGHGLHDTPAISGETVEIVTNFFTKNLK